MRRVSSLIEPPCRQIMSSTKASITGNVKVRIRSPN
jgi:hypothetical protein